MQTAIGARIPKTVHNSLLDEPLLVFSEIARKLGPSNGRPLHVSTLNRWRDAGIAGIKLEAIRLGGRWATSLEAVDRFIIGVSAARAQPMHTANIGSQRPSTSDKKELAAEGL